MRVFTQRLTNIPHHHDARGALPELTLPFGLRQRSRQRLVLDNGEQIGIILPQGTVLDHNDILSTEDGHHVRVRAACENVLQVRAHNRHQLMLAAYHLGNRHVALEIQPEMLQLEFDAVLQDMLSRMPGILTRGALAPFRPETGAYGGGHKHGHDETFDEDYALAQAAFQAHHPHHA